MSQGTTTAVAHEIVDGALGPGSVLSLAELQAKYTISRTVAREVMRRLEHVGMVTSRRRVGIVVQPASNWDVLDPAVIAWRMAGPGRSAQLRSLTELRTAVEPVAAAAAAVNATPDQRARITALSRDLVSSGVDGDLGRFLSVDIEFHTLVMTASGNELFARLSGVLAATLTQRTHLGLMPEHPRSESLAGHTSVAESIAAGRSDDAHRAMSALLRDIRRELFGS